MQALLPPSPRANTKQTNTKNPCTEPKMASTGIPFFNNLTLLDLVG